MNAQDIDLRNITYQRFIQLGSAPSATEIAKATGLSTEAVRSSWRRLHDAHALVLDALMAEIRMANPFSAVPTQYRVHAGGKSWYANCAWDAIGICAALHCDGRIDTVCPDCHETMTLNVRSQQVDRPELLFHCLVSAAHWWDDIVFT